MSAGRRGLPGRGAAGGPGPVLVPIPILWAVGAVAAPSRLLLPVPVRLRCGGIGGGRRRLHRTGRGSAPSTRRVPGAGVRDQGNGLISVYPVKVTGAPRGRRDRSGDGLCRGAAGTGVFPPPGSAGFVSAGAVSVRCTITNGIWLKPPGRERGLLLSCWK